MYTDFSRRNNLIFLTPAEKAIYDAMQKVKEMPADMRLTDAVNLLQQAQNKVADYVDEQLSNNNITAKNSCEHDWKYRGERLEGRFKCALCGQIKE